MHCRPHHLHLIWLCPHLSFWRVPGVCPPLSPAGKALTFHGVHHVALICENLERSLEFYQGILGASNSSSSSSSSVLLWGGEQQPSMCIFDKMQTSNNGCDVSVASTCCALLSSMKSR